MLRLAYFVELTWLLIDMLSGYLQNHGIFLPGNQTLSALVRVGTVILFLEIMLRNATPKRLLIPGLLLVCFMWISVHAIAVGLGGEANLAADIQFFLKLMLPVLLFGVLRVQMEQGVLNGIKVRRIILLNAIVLILNLSLGLFGIGFGNYGESDNGEIIGSKGFFYAGNEVSATLVAIFALVMFVYRDRFKQNSLLMLAVVGLFFIASLTSLSKTSLLGFLLVLIFVAHSYLSRARMIKFIAVLVLTTLASASLWLPLLQLSMERWEYFWELSPDFLTFITSGRSDRIDRYLVWLHGADSLWPLFFGKGQVAAELAASFENDFLDLTYNAGVLGLVFYCVWASWSLSGLARSAQIPRSNRVFTCYTVGMFVMLSVFAGHVMYSAMLAPFIALLALTSSRVFPGTPAIAPSSTSQQ